MKLIVMITMLVFGSVNACSAAFLEPAGKIPMPAVKGRIDHMAIDVNGRRLFVTALGNNTVEVIDLNSNERIHTITGLSEPQGVLFPADSNRLYVTSGTSGSCDVFDGGTFKLIGKINFPSDADNIRYYFPDGLIYVGYGQGGLGIIDTKTDRIIGQVKLSGHPEAFEIEPDGNRIFVNVPEAGHIAVVNRKKMEVEAVWPIKNAGGNFPVALDANEHHLFVCCRHPARLMIFDTITGSVIEELQIDSDADDIFYDRKNNRVYISCGGGFIDVVGCSGGSSYKVLEKIPTAKGARTSLLAADTGYLYLAVPVQSGKTAEIRIYRIGGE